jgi:hypothetical protein
VSTEHAVWRIACGSEAPTRAILACIQFSVEADAWIIPKAVEPLLV